MNTINPFQDQRTFMEACGQTVDHFNPPQFMLYSELIREETAELVEAINKNDPVETLDALIDILVVTVGALNSMGADSEGAWREVMRSNFAKIDPITGKAITRADGKILKPPGWTPPHLQPYLKG